MRQFFDRISLPAFSWEKRRDVQLLGFVTGLCAYRALCALHPGLNLAFL